MTAKEWERLAQKYIDLGREIPSSFINVKPPGASTPAPRPAAPRPTAAPAPTDTRGFPISLEETQAARRALFAQAQAQRPPTVPPQPTVDAPHSVFSLPTAIQWATERMTREDVTVPDAIARRGVEREQAQTEPGIIDRVAQGALPLLQKGLQQALFGDPRHTLADVVPPALEAVEKHFSDPIGSLTLTGVTRPWDDPLVRGTLAGELPPTVARILGRETPEFERAQKESLERFRAAPWYVKMAADPTNITMVGGAVKGGLLAARLGAKLVPSATRAAGRSATDLARFSHLQLLDDLKKMEMAADIAKRERQLLSGAAPTPLWRPAAPGVVGPPPVVPLKPQGITGVLTDKEVQGVGRQFKSLRATGGGPLDIFYEPRGVGPRSFSERMAVGPGGLSARVRIIIPNVPDVIASDVVKQIEPWSLYKGVGSVPSPAGIPRRYGARAWQKPLEGMGVPWEGGITTTDLPTFPTARPWWSPQNLAASTPEQAAAVTRKLKEMDEATLLREAPDPRPPTGQSGFPEIHRDPTGQPKSYQEQGVLLGLKRPGAPIQAADTPDDIKLEAMAQLGIGLRATTPELVKLPTRFQDVPSFIRREFLGYGRVDPAKRIDLIPGFSATQVSDLNRAKKVVLELAEVSAIPRVIMTAFDLSAPLRQGIVAGYRHPVAAKRAFMAQLRAWGSETSYHNLLNSIRDHPMYTQMVESGLHLSGISGAEEVFSTKYMKGLRMMPGIRASERAYNAFLIKLRVDLFEQFARHSEDAARAGGKSASEYRTQSAGFINEVTGRGTIGTPGGKLDRWVDLLSPGFFAPRLFISRAKLPLHLIGSLRRDNPISQRMGADLAVFIAGLSTTMAMAKMAGADVETDPRSSRFGQIGIGPTAIDLTGGLRPIAIAAIRLGTGETKTAYGAERPINRGDVLWRFFLSKASPWVGAEETIRTKETFIGQPTRPTIPFTGFWPGRDTDVTVTGRPGAIISATAATLPLVGQDIAEAFKAHGLTGLGLGVAPMLGAGMTTYDESLYPYKLVGYEFERIGDTNQRMVDAQRRLWLEWLSSRDDRRKDMEEIDPFLRENKNKRSRDKKQWRKDNPELDRKLLLTGDRDETKEERRERLGLEPTSTFTPAQRLGMQVFEMPQRR